MSARDRISFFLTVSGASISVSSIPGRWTLPRLQHYRKVKQKFPGFKTTSAELTGHIRTTFRRTIAEGFEMRSQTSLRNPDERLDLALLRAEPEGMPLPGAFFGKLDPESVVQAVPGLSADRCRRTRRRRGE